MDLPSKLFSQLQRLRAKHPSPEDIKKALVYVGATAGFGNEWLCIAGYKLFADGVLRHLLKIT